MELFLPRFQLTAVSDLGEDLSALGMKSAFIPGGLTGISDSPDSSQFRVAHITHSVAIEVHERGTEAFALGVVGSAAACVLPEPPKPPAVFRADHPFVFLIRDAKTGAILFIGRFAKPDEAASL